MWALKEWSLNTGGLLIKGACTVWLSFGTPGSGRSRQVVTEYKWSQDRFHCIDNWASDASPTHMCLFEILVCIYIYMSRKVREVLCTHGQGIGAEMSIRNLH